MEITLDLSPRTSGFGCRTSGNIEIGTICFLFRYKQDENIDIWIIFVFFLLFVYWFILAHFSLGSR